MADFPALLKPEGQETEYFRVGKAGHGRLTCFCRARSFLPVQFPDKEA
jgi:hypothetical protein